jgi:hypothetical protein
MYNCTEFGCFPDFAKRPQNEEGRYPGMLRIFAATPALATNELLDCACGALRNAPAVIVSWRLASSVPVSFYTATTTGAHFFHIAWSSCEYVASSSSLSNNSARYAE